MIPLIIFLVCLTIFQMVNIFDMKKEDRKKLVIIYSVFLLLTVVVSLYYDENKYDTSIASHLLKILRIDK